MHPYGFATPAGIDITDAWAPLPSPDGRSKAISQRVDRLCPGESVVCVGGHIDGTTVKCADARVVGSVARDGFACICYNK